jgi:hypothetical protein
LRDSRELELFGAQLRRLLLGFHESGPGGLSTAAVEDLCITAP